MHSINACILVAKSVLGVMSCAALVTVPRPASMPLSVYSAELSRCEWDGWHAPSHVTAADPFPLTVMCLRYWTSVWPKKVSAQPAFDRAEAPAMLFRHELPAPLDFPLPIRR